MDAALAMAMAAVLAAALQVRMDPVEVLVQMAAVLMVPAEVAREMVGGATAKRAVLKVRRRQMVRHQELRAGMAMGATGVGLMARAPMALLDLTKVAPMDADATDARVRTGAAHVLA
jgi:hypothetical protein